MSLCIQLHRKTSLNGHKAGTDRALRYSNETTQDGRNQLKECKEAKMLKETFNGNDGFNSRYDGNALNQFGSSPFGPQEGSGYYEIVNLWENAEQPHLDIHLSNSRLDKYLFYFSSRL